MKPKAECEEQVFEAQRAGALKPPEQQRSRTVQSSDQLGLVEVSGKSRSAGATRSIWVSSCSRSDRGKTVVPQSSQRSVHQMLRFSGFIDRPRSRNPTRPLARVIGADPRGAIIVLEATFRFEVCWRPTIRNDSGAGATSGDRLELWGPRTVTLSFCTVSAGTEVPANGWNG